MKRFLNGDGQINVQQGIIGVNLFTYCLNNPVNMVDYNGNMAEAAIIVSSSTFAAFCAWLSVLGSINVWNPVGWTILIVLSLGVITWAALSLYDQYQTERISTTYDTLGNIARKYGNLKCKEAAQAMKRTLTKSKLHGAFITLNFPNAFRGYVMSKRTGDEAISHTGMHIGVLYEGRVFCNIYPEGLPEDEWIKQFYDWTGKKPIVTKIYF